MKKNRKWIIALLLAMAMLLPTVVSGDDNPENEYLNHDITPESECEEGDCDYNYVSEVPATCLVRGKAAHYKCTYCHKLYHVAYDLGAPIPGTQANSEGEFDISPLGHEPGEVLVEAVDPTCLAPGQVGVWKCSRCTQPIIQNEENEWVITNETNPPIAQLIHRFEYLYETIVWADDYTYLQVTAKCEMGCNNSVRVTVPRQETYVDREPTCTEDGLRVHWAGIPEDPGFLEPYQPWAEYMHIDFGDSKDEVLKAGHAWNDGVVTTPAACESDGVKTFACTREGCSATKTEPVSATGHSWGEWHVVTPATTEADGLERCVCANNAGHTQERKIDRLPAPSTSPQPTAAPGEGDNGGGNGNANGNGKGNNGNVNGNGNANGNVNANGDGETDGNGNGNEETDANGGLSLWLAALALAASSPVLITIAGK